MTTSSIRDSGGFRRVGRGTTAAVTRLRSQGALGVAVTVSVVIVIGFVLYPTFQIIERSASPEARAVWGGLFKATATRQVLQNTVAVGLAVGAIGTLVGLLMAFVQVRTDLRYRRILHFITLIPVVSPPFAVAMSIITLFGRSGLITRRLFGVRYDIFGADGLILGLVISFMPIAYLSFIGMLQSFDRSLEEAATDLGAGFAKRMRTIVLPLLAPGIANSFLLLFVSAIADLGNPLVLGGNFDVLSSRIFLAIVGEFNLDLGAILSVLLLVPSLLVFMLQYLWLRRKSFVTVTGQPAGITARRVQRPMARLSLYAMATALAGFIVLVYGYIVVGAFTEVWNINFTPTLRHFRFVLQGPGWEALSDTVKLAAMATPIASAAGLVIAFVVTQRQFRGRQLLDFASIVGVAIPGTVVGIGLILAFNTPKLGGLVPKLTGTALIIVLAFVVRALPGAVRVAVGSLNQLSPSLEEASVMLGATRGQSLMRIILPLIRPAVFAGLVWSFARSMTSLSPVIFLVTPQWRLMTAQILNEAELGRFGNASAYCLILMAVMLLAMGLLALTSGVRGDKTLATE